MAGKTSKKALSFENGLEMLENIAQQMESSDKPLDELMKLYEEGLKLAQDLETRLQSARGRMQEIRKNQGGKPEAVPCDVEQQISLLPSEEDEA
ncbi:MAG: exodeoxyribonuclease VII small subunit [Clostridia bacterium]|nr:exodeoxyribonuclease VII small subunit [Clostridia bacterium]